MNKLFLDNKIRKGQLPNPYELTNDDVGAVINGFGIVDYQDVGKRVYLVEAITSPGCICEQCGHLNTLLSGGFAQVENDEQRDRRKAREE